MPASKKYQTFHNIALFLLLASFFVVLFMAKTDLKIIEYRGIYGKLYDNQKLIAFFFSLIAAYIGVLPYKEKRQKIFRFILSLISGMIFFPIYIGVVGDYLLKTMLLNENKQLITEKVVLVDKHQHKSRGNMEYYITMKNKNLDFGVDVDEKIFNSLQVNDTIAVNYYLLDDKTKYIDKNNVIILEQND